MRRLTQQHLEERPFTLLDVAVTRMGRNSFVVAYPRPEGAVEAATLDRLRDELQRAYAQQLGLVKAEIIFSETPPFNQVAVTASPFGLPRGQATRHQSKK